MKIGAGMMLCLFNDGLLSKNNLIFCDGGRVTVRDDWGQDPSVRMMRQIFAHMEIAQGKLLGRLDISPYDSRLRRWRKEAHELFERAYTLAAKEGVMMGEERAASIYLNCLRQALSRDGVEVADEVVPGNPGITPLVSEEER